MAEQGMKRTRASQTKRWMRQLGAPLILAAGFLATAGLNLSAQSDGSSTAVAGPLDIRVEAREVVVPIYVDYAKLLADQKLEGPSNGMPQIPMDQEFSGLTAKDFHIFEDGVEQPVKGLSIEPLRFWRIRDDGGVSLLKKVEQEFNSDMEKILSDHGVSATGEITYRYAHCPGLSHMEYSDTPRGFWSGRDMCTGEFYMVPHDASNHAVFLETNPTRDSKSGQLHIELLSYVPPQSVEGSCHQIKVKVDRPDASLYARSQYCDVHKSSSDPLKGTRNADQMEGEAASAQEAKLPLSVQAAATFNEVGVGRVNIAVEVPLRALSTYWDGNYRAADVDLLGLIYRADGTLALRFSDAAYSPKIFDFRKANRLYDFRDVWAKEYIESRLPARYETQIDLPPGNYSLRIVVTDGKNFGRADVPFTVESYAIDNLSLSGIVLSKRFVEMAAVWPPPNPAKDVTNRAEPTKRELSTAPDYVPLVSEEKGYTPTGDTVFRQGDLLLPYFEVYEPLLSAGQAKVQLQMLVRDIKTGQVQLNSGLRPADSYVRQGNPIIPVGWSIPIDMLAKGSYRVEIQASDSAGKKTDWRAASFTVE